MKQQHEPMNPKKRGTLYRAMGLPEGKKLTMGDLMKAPKTGKGC